MSWFCTGCGATVQDGFAHGCLDVGTAAKTVKAAVSHVVANVQPVVIEHVIEEAEEAEKSVAQSVEDFVHAAKEKFKAEIAKLRGEA